MANIPDLPILRGIDANCPAQHVRITGSALAMHAANRYAGRPGAFTSDSIIERPET